MLTSGVLRNDSGGWEVIHLPTMNLKKLLNELKRNFLFAFKVLGFSGSNIASELMVNEYILKILFCYPGGSIIQVKGSIGNPWTCITTNVSRERCVNVGMNESMTEKFSTLAQKRGCKPLMKKLCGGQMICCERFHFQMVL